MNILFYHHNGFLLDELREFFGDQGGQPHFADTVESAISILNTHPMDAAFVEVRRVSDIGIIKYINQYFPDLRIVLLVENDFETVISAIREGRYEMLRAPLGLGEIGRFISSF